jgi:eukaryotic-like serine/threonine-protein kinase
VNYTRSSLDSDLTRLAPRGGEDDPRLAMALREYLSAVEAGRRADIPELLSRHPDIAEELLACIQGVALVNTAAAQMGAGDTEAELPKQPLGDFKLIRQIGRGGMGIVYEAVQLSLGRRVAVKVLPLAAALDQKHLQRFKQEAQAAAQLHHTNIVPVYAVGCERGVHFYAMQLIDGESLADVIEQLRDGNAPMDSSASLTGESLPTQTLSILRGRKRAEYFRMVARLGVQAADALNYAHQLGVVHRDIKPANLMVDRRANLWITDFGLAQFYNDAGLTRTGDILGTLRYMSPEQASGRATVLDQRTDIYSLGATLYELATLQCALPGETREELLRQIVTVEPRPPRTLDKSVPIELQTILAKATAKEPSERYATAKALADDLGRFLSDQPILARPPSVWNRAIKWTRRHRALALSAIITLLITAVGGIVSTVLIAREQARTTAAYLLASEQRESAQKSFEQARQAVNFSTEVAADELPKDPQFNDVRKHLLEVALDYYQSFIDEHRVDPSIGAELVAAKARAFSILTELSAMDEMGRLMFDIHLLDDESVQRDLDLSPDQTAKIKSLDEPWSPGPPREPGGPGNFPPPPRPTPEQVAARTTQAQASLNSILSAAQLQRLRQVSRQIRGVAAFSDPDVQQALALTDAQKQTIRKLRADLNDHRHMRRGPGELSPDADLADNSAMVKLIVNQLAPIQRQSWAELTGKPFTGSFYHFGPGFGFGP